jgi:alpha-L-arabinofuranosidase
VSGFRCSWSDARRANGREEPYGITMWCPGNEMDGPWQLGHRSAEDYGKIASQTAKAMKQLDPSVRLAARSWPRHGPTARSTPRAVTSWCVSRPRWRSSCVSEARIRAGG